MTITTLPFDASEFFRTRDEIDDLMLDALDSGNENYLTFAFGIGKLIDADNLAMTAIEGINSAPVGGIDRKPNIMWDTFGREK